MKEVKTMWSWIPWFQPVYKCTNCDGLNWFNRIPTKKDILECEYCNKKSKLQKGQIKE